MQIVGTISLGLDNLQGFQGLKDMLENLLQSLWELLQDIRNKITSFNADTCAVFRREPSQARSSGGRPKYIITREHIEVLRGTGMQWTAIARCLGVSQKPFTGQGSTMDCKIRIVTLQIKS